MQLPTGLTVARSLLVATLVLVLVLGAAGCSSDPAEPATIDTTAPDPTRSSATPSATPTPTATPVKQQVEAAVRTYYAELTRAAQTNDAADLSRLVTRSCPCWNAVKIIRRNVREGETTPDARFTLRSTTVHDVAGRSAAAEVKYRVSDYDVLASDGSVKTHIKKQSSHLDLSLIQVDGTWLIANLFDLER